jgi:hypothetical protein
MEAAMTLAGEKTVEIAKSEATPCMYCSLGMKPAKLRRRWVHHFPRQGINIACLAKNLKPGS